MRTKGVGPPPERPQQHGAEEDTPLETILSDLLGRMRVLAHSPDAKLTCNAVIDIVGPRSHVLAILIFCVLNLLPGPPGYSSAVGLAIMAFSTMLFFDMPIQLWSLVGERRLPLRLLLKLLEFFSGFTRIVSQFSRPRAAWLTSERVSPAIGILGFTLGVAMLVPIPLTNTLPSLGLAVVCVGTLNRDGLALLAGVTISLVGLAVLIAALWAVFVVSVLLGEAFRTRSTTRIDRAGDKGPSTRMDDETLQVLVHHPALRPLVLDEAEVAAAAHDFDLLTSMENIDDGEIGAVALANVHHCGGYRQVGLRPNLSLSLVTHVHRNSDT